MTALGADRRPTTESQEPGISHIDISLRGPAYYENSHANRTWYQHSHHTTCFKDSETPALWVRFPSPAPLLRHRQAAQGYRIGINTLIRGLPYILGYPCVAPAFTRTVTRSSSQKARHTMSEMKPILASPNTALHSPKDKLV
jgi:hypothetical protein